MFVFADAYIRHSCSVLYSNYLFTRLVSGISCSCAKFPHIFHQQFDFSAFFFPSWCRVARYAAAAQTKQIEQLERQVAQLHRALERSDSYIDDLERRLKSRTDEEETTDESKPSSSDRRLSENENGVEVVSSCSASTAVSMTTNSGLTLPGALAVSHSPPVQRQLDFSGESLKAKRPGQAKHVQSQKEEAKVKESCSQQECEKHSQQQRQDGIAEEERCRQNESVQTCIQLEGTAKNDVEQGERSHNDQRNQARVVGSPQPHLAVPPPLTPTHSLAVAPVHGLPVFAPHASLAHSCP